MKLNITARNFHRSDAIREYVAKKIEKLKRSPEGSPVIYEPDKPELECTRTHGIYYIQWQLCEPGASGIYDRSVANIMRFDESNRLNMCLFNSKLNGTRYLIQMRIK